MQAVLVTDAGARPTLVDRPSPQSGPGRTLVTMEAVGLHQVVRARAAGRHYTSHFPMVLGVDGVGVTPDGRRVWCMTMDHSGSGTLAEQVSVPDELLVPVPDGLDPVAVAASVNPLFAAWMSLSPRGGLQQGQHVVVLGATGAAGRGTLALARGIAGRTTAVGRDRAALDAMVGDGLATDAVVIGDEESLADVAATADLCVDFLWGPVAEALWAAVAEAPRRPGQTLTHVQVGTMAGPNASLPGSVLRSRDVRLLGSAPGAYAMSDLMPQVPTVLGRMASDGLSVEHTRYGLAELDEAWAHAGTGRAVVDLR